MQGREGASAQALLGLGAGGLGLAVFTVWVSTLRLGRAKPVAERLRGE